MPNKYSKWIEEYLEDSHEEGGYLMGEMFTVFCEHFNLDNQWWMGKYLTTVDNKFLFFSFLALVDEETAFALTH